MLVSILAQTYNKGQMSSELRVKNQNKDKFDKTVCYLEDN